MSTEDTLVVSKARLREIKREVDTLTEERDLLGEQLAQLREEHEELRAHLKGSIAEVVRLRQENDRLRAEPGRAAAPLAAPETPAPEPRAPEPDALTAEEEYVADVFVAWCNRGGPLIGQAPMFERFLQKTLPDARVHPAYRDPSAARPTFSGEASGGPEHWVVQQGAALVLLPQPASPAAFRELAPAFGGAASPQSVREVDPARLTPHDGVLVLDAPGRIA